MILFFDECMPPWWFRQLRPLLEKRREPIRSYHLLEQLESGTKDDAIVAWLKSQSERVVVISADSGIHSGSNPRLPVLCPAHGITSVFVARKLCQRDGFEKFRMIIVCLPGIVEAYNGHQGERYRLKSHGETLYRIEPWPVLKRRR